MSILDMKDIVSMATEDERRAAIAEYEAFMHTNLIAPHGAMTTMVMKFRSQHKALESIPLVSAMKDMVLEIYKYYANLFFYDHDKD